VVVVVVVVGQPLGVANGGIRWIAREGKYGDWSYRYNTMIL